GVQGALVGGPAWLRDLLINTARSFIYSTGPSPWIAAAIMTSLDLVPSFSWERDHLQNLANRLRRKLQQFDFDIGCSDSQVVPVIVGNDGLALQLTEDLRELGIFVSAIRPPTVAEGSARLRLSLTSNLSEANIDKIVDALVQVRKAI